MKKSLLFVLIFIGASMNAWACIDPNPDAVIVNLSVETVNCDLLIEVTNLRIMGGDPNQFCSCGVNNIIAGLGDVVYLVFVDSLTNEPVIGFDQFDLNALAGDEWDLADSGFDWNGFVSDINSAGLLSDQAVSLWIRIDLNDTVSIDGFEFDPCEEPDNLEELIWSGALGTDEWDNTTNTLAEDHQSIAYFYNNEYFLNIVPDGFMDYYDDIVNGFYNSIDEVTNEMFFVYPNPVTDRLIVGQLPLDVEEIRLINVYGQVVLRQSSIVDEINLSIFPPGVYHVQFVGVKQDYLTKIVKL